uniref:Uncharacterized protein n=1 Tax=Manihot esculenta TaxID=3983 RepID=A0A2C9W5U0_MANES
MPNSICFELYIALLAKLCIKYLLTTHCTNPFGISTGVAVLDILVYLLLAIMHFVFP